MLTTQIISTLTLPESKEEADKLIENRRIFFQCALSEAMRNQQKANSLAKELSVLQSLYLKKYGSK